MLSITTLEALDCSLPSRVAEKLDEKKEELKMMPAAALQALELLKDPECSIAKFSQTIRRDVKLAASILSMANSVIYSPGHPISALNDAVVHVGLRQCRSLIQTCCASSLMKNLELADQQIRDALWRHSLTTATVAAELNQRFQLGFLGEEFTAGLLHDIGRLLLGSCFPDDFSQLDAVDFRETADTPQNERAVIETDHCAVGCTFAISNRLPAEIADAIRYHHAPERATIAPKLTATVAVADHLANHLEVNSATYDLSRNYGLPAWESCIGSTDTLADVVDSLLEKVEQDVASLLQPEPVA